MPTLAEKIERKEFFVAKPAKKNRLKIANYLLGRLAFQDSGDSLAFQLELHGVCRSGIAVRSHIDAEERIAGPFDYEGLKIFLRQFSAQLHRIAFHSHCPNLEHEIACVGRLVRQLPALGN